MPELFMPQLLIKELCIRQGTGRDIKGTVHETGSLKILAQSDLCIGV